MGQVYDYVIVGAGSAGCVLAARLTEDPDVQVALIEAGPPDNRDEIHIPAAFPAVFKSSLDWDLLGEPEPGLNGRRLYMPRGRVIGGSSSINAMIYIRGNRADYDEWAAMGHEGWGYEDVLPYFKRAEDNERGEDMYHGVGGPLSVSESRAMSQLVDTMIDAAKAAGHEENPDFNGARQEGVGRFQLTQRDGMRCSCAVAYLRPAENRPNLHVIPNAMAMRILFEGDRAVGVEISQSGQLEEVRAERELILSAGAFQSPVLLMISGIGPAADLEPMGIAMRQDLPVGENLQDHVMANVNYETTQEGLFGAFNPENIELLMNEGRGPLSSNIPEGALFMRTRSGLEAPDIEFHFAPSMLYDEGLTAPHDHGVAFGPVVIKPTSRGRVMLRAPMPDSKPRVLCNFLTTDEDRQSMIAGVRMALQIAEQSPLKDVIRTGYSVPASDSDEDIWTWVQANAQTVYHPTSTCAMGAVVDSELRVLGVDGLRVVDASVMPTITRGNTNAPVIMIAEKAADLIREKAPAGAAAGAA
ncbi:MAG TPA: GMC family oxidoreductase N-terminal domain-containing protein [Thermoleophilaceae bacterium]|nr:GMC family oxidoreductase N-terminal domain-containing protein [Thermoleophilaceae bacterium]